jgi:membrane fusion protein, heavy metal efflux system
MNGGVLQKATLLAAALALGGCQAKSGGALAAVEEGPPQPRPTPGERAVVLTDTKLSDIRTDEVRERDRPGTLAASGKVQFDEGRVGRVLVPLAGPILELRAQVGDLVTKGQTLCVVQSREAALAVGDHIESHKDLELAEKTAAMSQDLFDHQAASKIALQQALNDLAKARSRVTRNEEALRALGLHDEDINAQTSGRVPVVSPLAGSVIERRVIEGQLAQADGTPIFTIADLSTVWVVGDIFERDLQAVAVGDNAAITTTAYPEPFAGRVTYISAVIDPATRTAKVRLSVANPSGRLKPEMFASIAFGARAHDRVLTVPSRAAFTEDGRTWVYIAEGRGRFVRRAIEVAQEAGDERRVLSGLQAGERVVVDGVLLIRQEEQRGAD